MKFDLIVADNPWQYDDRLERMKSPTKRSAHKQYDGHTMSVVELAALPVRDFAADDAVLAFWVPGSFIFEAPKIFEAWGFEYKQFGCWGKLQKNAEEKVRAGKTIAEVIKMNNGRLFRYGHEIWLMCIRGKNVYKRLLQNRGQVGLIMAEQLSHSTKPEAIQDALELMFPNARKLELFARRQRPGWTCLGNEIDGLDIREALERLRVGSAPAIASPATRRAARFVELIQNSSKDEECLILL